MTNSCHCTFLQHFLAINLSFEMDKMYSIFAYFQCYPWRKAKIPSYGHAIQAYDAAIVGLPSQIVYDGWQKIHHAIPP
ncbi:hypothetical protein GYH30_027358 [Glycine max]|uniref:Uncharacterized protein n=1 Tax=Glycine max TaxID=3847 RepID=A0A0R0I249_SOYBN|nr:hypothetical protein GYH30_027358 [Glycine max]